MKTNRINFYDQLFEKQIVPNCILKINYHNSGVLLYKSDNHAVIKLKYNNFSIQIVPKYLDITYHPNLKHKIINENRLGYATLLDNYNDVNSFLIHQYKKNAKPILKRIKRLENCFNISYVLFYGTITRKSYDFLMYELKEMIIKRFGQRNDSNYRLKEWDYLYDTAFDLINKKRASLYVIYNAEAPIQINLQYHFKDILISSVVCYDIDYQIFGLGNTAIYKQIEWCIENNYSIYDQGHGDLEYKRRWSNLIYNFNHHVVYYKKGLLTNLIAYKEVFKVVVKSFLRKKKVANSKEKIKNYFFNNKVNQADSLEHHFKIVKIESIEGEIENFLIIDWKLIEYKFLRKIIYDFLYYNFEHCNNIEVFKNKHTRGEFIICGENNFQKVLFS